jgi:hypothetical protein
MEDKEKEKITEGKAHMKVRRIKTEARKRKKTNADGFRNRRRNIKELGKAAVQA